MKMSRNYYIASSLGVLALIAYLILSGQKKLPADEVSPAVPAPAEENQLAQNPTDSLSLPENNSGQLLPDLTVAALTNPRIETAAGGKKILRFPGTFLNTGDGPLELIGVPDPAAAVTRAFQRVYRTEGNPEERPVGNFIFHQTHSHWHFENFVEFEIWSLKNKGELDQKITSTGKMTFCIHDYAPLPDAFPGKPSRIVYPWCDSSADIQGISVGWVDTYQADVPGQELDISAIPDGVYAFRSTADPDNLLVEKEENNNSTITYFEIKKDAVRVLESLP